MTREIRPETAEAIREKYSHFPGLVEWFVERGIWSIQTAETGETA